MTLFLSDLGIETAHRMRNLMGRDLDEYDMAEQARGMALTPLELSEAWPALDSTERTAWKKLLELERPDVHRY